MTNSPTGFTYREKNWRKINPLLCPRKVTLAAIREAKLEGFSRSGGLGMTQKEAVETLQRAQEEAQRAETKRNKAAVLITASECNAMLRSLPPLEPI